MRCFDVVDHAPVVVVQHHSQHVHSLHMLRMVLTKQWRNISSSINATTNITPMEKYDAENAMLIVVEVMPLRRILLAAVWDPSTGDMLVVVLSLY